MNNPIQNYMKAMLMSISILLAHAANSQELESIVKMKSSYDRFQEAGASTERIFVRTNAGELLKPDTLAWSDSIALVYRVFSEQEQIKLIGVYEKDGDWSGSHVYYFDEEGIVFSYVHALDAFNTQCADTLNVQTTFFFDKDSNILEQQLLAKDEHGQVITSDSCIYRNPYQHYFYSDLEEFMLKVENYRAIDEVH